MRVLGIRTATTVSRFACAAAVLFIFFFPLHFHFSLGAQLTSQCSCLQGARAQMVLPDDSQTVTPPPQIAVVLEPQVREWNFTAPQRPFVRGPPLSLSV
jgi:hypothetical protein